MQDANQENCYLSGNSRGGLLTIEHKRRRIISALILAEAGIRTLPNFFMMEIILFDLRAYHTSSERMDGRPYAVCGAEDCRIARRHTPSGSFFTAQELLKIMVARFSEVYAGQVGSPLWPGVPVRAKLAQASPIK